MNFKTVLNVQKTGIYVCIEVALCGEPMEKGVQLDLGRGPIEGSNVPTPRVPYVPHHTLWCMITQCAFCSPLYYGHLSVICILI